MNKRAIIKTLKYLNKNYYQLVNQFDSTQYGRNLCSYVILANKKELPYNLNEEKFLAMELLGIDTLTANELFKADLSFDLAKAMIKLSFLSICKDSFRKKFQLGTQLLHQ